MASATAKNMIGTRSHMSSQSNSFYFAIALATTTLLACDSFAQDWPQYRGPNATGRLESADLKLGTGKLKIHWKVPCSLGFSSFSVAAGKAITVVGRQEQECCIALNANTGREIWAQPLGSSNYGSGGGNAGAQNNKGGDGPRTTPAISGDKVFVYDAHLKLHCFNLADGKKNWSRDIAKEFDGKNIKWKNATSPLIDDGHVYIAGGGKEHSFLAFDHFNGQLKWSSGSETLTHASPAFASLGGKKLVVFFMQFGLVAVDAESGSEAWRIAYPFNVSTAASPIVSGNQIYCSAGYGVGAGLFEISDAKSTSEIWRMPNRLINHWSSPVLRDKHLFGLYRFKRYGNAPLQCIEFSTGKICWKQPGFGQGNCIVVGDKIVVLSDAGELAIVAAVSDKYDELWRGKILTGKCWSTPAFSDGKIFLRSTKEAVCVSFD